MFVSLATFFQNSYFTVLALVHVWTVFLQISVYSVIAAVTVVLSQLSALSTLWGNCNQPSYNGFVSIVGSVFDVWIKNQLLCHFFADAVNTSYTMVFHVPVA